MTQENPVTPKSVEQEDAKRIAAILEFSREKTNTPLTPEEEKRTEEFLANLNKDRGPEKM